MFFTFFFFLFFSITKINENGKEQKWVKEPAWCDLKIDVTHWSPSCLSKGINAPALILHR